MLTYSLLGRNGRLGNQMFQYAAMLGIAEKAGHEVAIPSCELTEAFDLSAIEVPSRAFRVRHYRELHFHFDPGVFEHCSGTQDTIDLNGYFQSHRYFEHVADRVRREFSLRNELVESVHSRIVLARTLYSSVVGIHIRRGDYLSKPEYHPAYGVEYVRKAIEHVPDGAGFIVCSDDLAWCREHLEFLRPIYSMGFTAAQDLILLSLCDHVIASNGSFGWWAAWLREDPAKVVTVPDPWFGPKGPQDVQDLVPDGWVKVRT